MIFIQITRIQGVRVAVTAQDFGAQEYIDLDNGILEYVGQVDLVFDVLGGDIATRSAGIIRPEDTLVTIAGPIEARPIDCRSIDFIVEANRGHLTELAQKFRGGLSPFVVMLRTPGSSKGKPVLDIVNLSPLNSIKTDPARLAFLFASLTFCINSNRYRP